MALGAVPWASLERRVSRSPGLAAVGRAGEGRGFQGDTGKEPGRLASGSTTWHGPQRQVLRLVPNRSPVRCQDCTVGDEDDWEPWRRGVMAPGVAPVEHRK